MAEIPHTGTEYAGNSVTLERGTVDDIVSVGVYHTTDPGVIPAVADFVEVTLVDGTAEPPDPLSSAGLIDVLSLIGPRDGQVELAAGDYQRWVLVTTATEDIIRRPDTITVL